MIYEFTYVREQRAHIEIEAKNIEEATSLAWEKARKLPLKTPADNSDDPGDLWLDEIRMNS